MNVASYFSLNGKIDKAMLFKSTFYNLNDQGIYGVFDDDAEIVKVVRIIDEINENAIVA